MLRAVAPACRKVSKKSQIDREPSVSWLPYRASPIACSIRTRLQSASSSSAATRGSDVRIPVPISDRCVTMKTVPSASMPR